MGRTIWLRAFCSTLPRLARSYPAERTLLMRQSRTEERVRLCNSSLSRARHTIAHKSGTVQEESASGAHRPLRVCVVGSGPAGFYVTKYLLKEEEAIPGGISVDIVDRLPTPFGLVRFGVAPDHPEVKAVQNDFEQVASDPRVHFFGNVRLGSDISAAQLSELYDVVVLAYGAAGDREITAPGSDLEGVFAARAFVSWYNGHPDFAHMSDNFRAALASSDTVAVVGAGNVALDCARILAKGANALRDTDICEHTLDVLSTAGAGLRRVLVLGRRGHVQASFTIKELRELTRLDEAGCLVRPSELELGRTPASLGELKEKRPKSRIDALLTKVGEASDGFARQDKAVELRFLVGLSEIIPSEVNSSRVGAIRIERNQLQLDQATGAQRAVGSGDQSEVIECGMVLGSIGYRCVPVDGVPYDDRKAIIANEGGRVQGMTGMYCSGWARRGPSGIIGTNITDARSVVAAIVEDVREQRLPLEGDVEGRHGLSTFLRKGERTAAADLRDERNGERIVAKPTQIVTWDGYVKIDGEEVKRGAAKGKPREKFVEIQEMLTIAGSSAQ